MKTITVDTHKSLNILKLYNTLPKLIADRTTELLNPYQISDENIGGGKGGMISNPTEDDVIALCDDEILAAYTFVESVIYIVCQYFKENPFDYDTFIEMLDEGFDKSDQS